MLSLFNIRNFYESRFRGPDTREDSLISAPTRLLLSSLWTRGRPMVLNTGLSLSAY